VVALFGTVLALAGYFAYGRGGGSDDRKPPFAVMVGKAACHCGSGCTLGDIAAEWLAFAFPGIAVALGWHTVFADKAHAVWVLDFIFAFLIGIAFQYFTIVPMRKLAPLEGLWAALKADKLSLIAWQVGMYGFMAFAAGYIFREHLGVTLDVDMPAFWFMMQIAMICGFITSYPVNWWLLKAGLKERM
jgi:hypothetical protein